MNIRRCIDLSINQVSFSFNILKEAIHIYTNKWLGISEQKMQRNEIKPFEIQRTSELCQVY